MALESAAEAVWIAHGLVMNGGVLHCIESLSKRALEAAIQGYRLFELTAAAEVLSEAMKVSVDQANEAEERLNAEYSEAVPSDAVLEALINDRFPPDHSVATPNDQSPVAAALAAFIEHSAEAVRLSIVPGKTRIQHRAHHRAEGPLEPARP